MPGLDIFDQIESLRETGQPFCVATVLRTADVTSAKAGAKAAVTQEGEILGHLGGACVQRAVLASVSQAIAHGEPQMIRVKPSDKVVSVVDPDGVQCFKSGCPSGGTVDLLIEPYAPSSRLAIYGEGPIAVALAAHAELMGLRVWRAEGQNDQVPVLAAHDFVVVASQGRGDAVALRAALESGAGRVSMVASRRKAAHLVKKLVADGIPEPTSERLKSPAGLDIGAIDPHEIALSILAEIVQWRSADKTKQKSPVVVDETVTPQISEKSASDAATEAVLRAFPRCC